MVEVSLQYLYTDGESWHFMDEQSFEQYAAPREAVGDSASWLKEQDVCTLTLWNGEPLGVSPPNFVVLEITETDPGSTWGYCEWSDKTGDGRDGRDGESASLRQSGGAHPHRHPHRGVRRPLQAMKRMPRAATGMTVRAIETGALRCAGTEPAQNGNSGDGSA